MDPTEFNHDAWDRIAEENDRWFAGATDKQIELAISGDWNIKITPTKNVPKPWLEPIVDCNLLLLAGGGGQQAPVLAASGAKVTVVDFSATQLERDRTIAAENGLELELVQSDMRDLSGFANDSFDLIINPTSVCYCPEVQPIWREAFRVLRAGGKFICGFINPVNYLFDFRLRDRGKLIARHSIKTGVPYRDEDLPDEELKMLIAPQRPFEFGHSLTDLIGGQIEEGFAITGFYTDRWGGRDKLSDYIDVFVATCALKPN